MRLPPRCCPTGIAPIPAPGLGVPGDAAVIRRERCLVTLPPCPDWSKPAVGAGDFTNTASSNFGCATAVNLGLTVAQPADLVGRLVRSGSRPVQPAATAVDRYLNDKVALPAAPRIGPIAAVASSSRPPPPGREPRLRRQP